MISMTDSICKIYLYYLIADDGPELYGWSAKKKIAKMFEKTRDMRQFEKKTKVINVHELSDVFYEYGDRFIDIHLLTYGESKVKITITKLEWTFVQNTINANFICMQKSVINLNIDIFTDNFKKYLSAVELDKCLYSLSLNSPTIENLYTAQEFSIFMTIYGNLMKSSYIDELIFVENNGGKDKKKI